MDEFPPIVYTIIYFGSPFAAFAWVMVIGAWRNLGNLDNYSRKTWLACLVYGVSYVLFYLYIRSLT